MENEFKTWCPLSHMPCRSDCGMMAEGDLDCECAIKVIAEHLVGGSIGVRTYGGEMVCVTTDPDRTDQGFSVDVNNVGFH